MGDERIILPGFTGPSSVPQHKVEKIRVDKVLVDGLTRPLREDKVKELAASIQEVGLVHAISVLKVEGTDEYRLIAGLHRLEAYKALWHDYISATVLNLDEATAEMAKYDENLVRAELSVLERGEWLAKKKELFEALHPTTAHGGGIRKSGQWHRVVDSTTPSFTKEMAQKTGRGRSTVEQEVKIANDLSQGVKDLIRNTKLAHEKDKLLNLARVPLEEQEVVARKLLDGGARNVTEAKRQLFREDATEKAKTLPTSVADRYELYVGNVTDTLTLAPHLLASADLVLIDPPYLAEFVPVYGDCAMVGAEILKEGAALLALCGHSYVPQILNLMGEHLTYNWLIAYLCGDETPTMWDRSAIATWKPILMFAKGHYQHEGHRHFVDRLDGSGKAPRGKHVWAQNERDMEILVERFTEPGALVVDLCCGTSSVGEACLRLGRKFVGFDRDPVAVDLSRVRLDSVLKELEETGQVAVV